jgi:hypothetical protein
MRNETYAENVERLEPNISTVWGEVGSEQSAQATAQISMAMSLKRIADAMTAEVSPADLGIATAILADAIPRAASGQVADALRVLLLRGYKIVKVVKP